MNTETIKAAFAVIKTRLEAMDYKRAIQHIAHFFDCDHVKAADEITTTLWLMEDAEARLELMEAVNSDLAKLDGYYYGGIIKPQYGINPIHDLVKGTLANWTSGKHTDGGFIKDLYSWESLCRTSSFEKGFGQIDIRIERCLKGWTLQIAHDVNFDEYDLGLLKIDAQTHFKAHGMEYINMSIQKFRNYSQNQ